MVAEKSAASQTPQETGPTSRVKPALPTDGRKEWSAAAGHSHARAAMDPWRAAAPYVCFAEKVCDNGLTTWVRLVAYGK